MHTKSTYILAPMGYQFAHIQGYARTGSQQRKGDRMQPRKWGIRDIVAEAEREPDACPHVAAPMPPILLHGAMPSQAEAAAHAWAATAKDAKGRKLRTDGLCLLSGVISLPDERAEDWPQFRAATVQWLRDQYGERLQSVVEHTDEEHPHLHFYAVPLEGERFEVLHVGRQAAAVAAAEGKKKGAQNAAYKKAMQGWQDDFQEKVAASFGLARTGPGRERLTRGEWKARQAQLLADAQVAPPVITEEAVKKQVTKKRWTGKEYETSEELAARLDAVAQEKYAPALKAQALVTSARGRADAMQALADDNQRRADDLQARLVATESKLVKVEKDLAMYHEVFMAGLDGTEQATVIDKARDLRREKAAKAKAEQEAAWSPEVRAIHEAEEAAFKRALKEAESEEIKGLESEPDGPSL